MKAILVNEAKDLVWSEVPMPVIRDNEVLVKVHAAGVNRADLLQREGKYPPPAGCPEWMGLEIAGEVVETGAEVNEWKPGDRVCALLGGGGYAEYAAVRHDHLMPVPEGLSMEEAAALPEACATSYLNLFREGHLRAGQTVFIPAGKSGLASFAIPMAKAFGTRVITTVRSDEAKEKIRPLGADRILNSKTEDVAAALAEEERNGTPVAVAMDCLSGELIGQCLPYMARGGYWVVISTLAGTETTVPLRALLTRGLHLVGSMLRNRTPEYKAELLSELVKVVWPKIESGAIRPPIDRIIPIEKAAEAHAVLQRSENVGKVVLRIC